MKVELVGAGPGAADLMTVRAMRAVQGAEALLYDALIDPQVLDLAPARCLRICTGKRAGKTSMRQETINRLMLRLARQGFRVVRLKGGDPSIFGRSGEERAFLETHGVEVEVVPGVTAASAAAAQFGFPLTHRGEARRLLLATARTLDWAEAPLPRDAADPQTTLVLYMASHVAGPVAARLVAMGRPASTPALAVENAGREDGRLVTASLGELGEAVAAEAFEGPTLLLVGSVAARARKTGASRREAGADLVRACP